MTSHKIQKTHLERQAVIYIRQSSPLQVETNVESKRRQYQLVERVQTLGWHETQCTVIDDDQAISGAQSYNRPGFQQVISMMALREVGIILGLEVARLARNCLDWYQLLELAPQTTEKTLAKRVRLAGTTGPLYSIMFQAEISTDVQFGQHTEVF
jgi:hypothetical protein